MKKIVSIELSDTSAEKAFDRQIKKIKSYCRTQQIRVRVVLDIPYQGYIEWIFTETGKLFLIEKDDVSNNIVGSLIQAYGIVSFIAHIEDDSILYYTLLKNSSNNYLLFGGYSSYEYGIPVNFQLKIEENINTILDELLNQIR